MEKRMVLSPTYMTHFSCIGSACEDTCCSRWQIVIDKKTYERYEEEKLSLFRHLKRLDNPSQENYAEVMLTEDSFCPMLSTDQLCRIHMQMGETYLSNLCVTYPRVSNIVNGRHESSATVSCPEAARLALLQPGGIQFEEKDEMMEFRHLVAMKVNTAKPNPARPEQAYFLELRSLTIQILQNRKHSLDERLILLGAFLEQLRELLGSGAIEMIPQLISVSRELMEQGAARDGLPHFSQSMRTKLEFLRKMIDMRLFAGVRDKRYLQCLMEALEGLQYVGNTLREESIQLYQEAYQKRYVPFFSKHHYILENYLVNYVFKNLFPVKRDIWDEYMLLVSHYALIQFHLIGMMNYDPDGFGVDQVIKLIQSYSRTVEHAPAEILRFVAFLKENQYVTLAHMVNFIRN